MLKYLLLMTIAFSCFPANAETSKTGSTGKVLSTEQLSRLYATVKRINPGAGAISNVKSGFDARRSLIACGNIGKKPFLAIWDRRKNDWSTTYDKKQNEVFSTYITCAQNSIVLPAYANFLSPSSFKSTGGNYALSPSQEKLIKEALSKEIGTRVASLRGTAAFINTKKAVAVCGFAATSKGNIRFNGFLIADKSYRVSGIGRNPTEANAISYNCSKLYGIVLAGSL